MYFIHCWNDTKEIMAPKAQPHYHILADLCGLTKHPIFFGFSHIDSSQENIAEFINDKLFGKLKDYKHIGIWKTSGKSSQFAMYLWSIVLGYLRSGGDINDVKDPDVIQAMNLIRKNKSWMDCNVPHEIDLFICYEKEAECVLELDRNRFLSDPDYCIDICSDYGLLVSQSKIGFKTNIREPYKKEFIK